MTGAIKLVGLHTFGAAQLPMTTPEMPLVAPIATGVRPVKSRLDTGPGAKVQPALVPTIVTYSGAATVPVVTRVIVL